MAITKEVRPSSPGGYRKYQLAITSELNLELDTSNTFTNSGPRRKSGAVDSRTLSRNPPGKILG